MARHQLNIAIFIGLLTATLAAADTTVPVGEGYNGRPVTVGVVEPTVGDSQQGDEPVVSKPDEVFTGDFPVGQVQAGVDDGKPVLSGRKMLQDNPVQNAVEPNTLDLSGDGEEVGDSTLGAQGAASGHGTNSQEGGTHIEPHGVTGDASAAGAGVNGITANVNPDGLAGEGDVAQVGRR